MWASSVVSNSFETPWTVAHHAPVYGIFQARILEWIAISYSGEFPNPGIEPTSPAWVGGFFNSESPGKPLLSSRWGLLRIKSLTSLEGLTSSSCCHARSSWLGALRPSSPQQTSPTAPPTRRAPSVTASWLPLWSCLPSARCFWLLMEERNLARMAGCAQKLGRSPGFWKRLEMSITALVS